MESFHDNMNEYRKQLEKGTLQAAYRGLMEYFNALRLHFKKKYPDYVVSGSVYHGYMDMTYFSFFPNSLKRRQLKVAIVFLHDAFRFEVWLVGYNRTVQRQYWKLFTESNYTNYHITTPAKGVDAIIDHIVIENPDFSDLETLTKQIERGMLQFITDVETFVSKH
jgi:hypothetical protein